MNQSIATSRAEWKAYWPVVMSAMLGVGLGSFPDFKTLPDPENPLTA